MPTQKRNEGRETGRAYLKNGEEEKPGYGLYSYLLFGSPPTDATRERYLSSISAYLEIPKIESFEPYTPKCKMNVTYLPLTTVPDADVTAEWLLDHYDFARARVLLQKLAGPHRNGPYIISCYKPLSDIAGLKAQYLYQDLSSVPPRIVVLWVKEFLTQAEQEHFWDERIAMHCVLEIRKAIEIAAVGEPIVSKSLSTVLKWIS